MTVYEENIINELAKEEQLHELRINEGDLTFHFSFFDDGVGEKVWRSTKVTCDKWKCAVVLFVDMHSDNKTYFILRCYPSILSSKMGVPKSISKEIRKAFDKLDFSEFEKRLLEIRDFKYEAKNNNRLALMKEYFGTEE